MATPANEPNSPSAENVKAAVGKIEEYKAEKLAEHMAYMSRCRRINESISGVYALAKEQGIKRKLLRSKVKERELHQKIVAIREDLEADERNEYDMLTEKLGEFAFTPLGAAALAKAKPETLDALHS